MTNANPPDDRAAARARPLLARLALGSVGMLLVAGAWQAVVVAWRLDPVVLPTPLAVGRALAGLAGTAAFWRDVWASILEFGTGYALGAGLGVAVGALMGESRIVRGLLSPVVEGLRFIVPFAWIPLTVLWFGTSFTGKAVLVAYAVFFVMVVSTMRSLAQCDPVLSRVGTMLGMNRWQLAWRVHLRVAAPGIASAARAAAAIGWIAVVAAEYIGASRGLGVMITNAASSLATPVVIAGMVAIGVIGAVVSALIRAGSRAWLDYR